MEERKCFVCGDFEHIAHHYRNVGEERSILTPSNKFEVLKSQVMQKRKGSEKEERKDRRTILREEKLNKEKTVK